MTPPTNHEREIREALKHLEGLRSDLRAAANANGGIVPGTDYTQALYSQIRHTENRIVEMSSRPPKDHIRLEDGRDVKLLGVLPITADGCAYGHHSRYDKPLYGITDKGKVVEAAVRAIPVGDSSFRPEDCYSTKEAALSAHQENTGSTKHEG